MASNQLQSYILTGGVCKNCNRFAHAFAQKEIKSLLTNSDILLLYDRKLEVII
nr:MAG TPA: PPPDE putative peptidase domain [Caudoviricetes sp.]